MNQTVTGQVLDPTGRPAGGVEVAVYYGVAPTDSEGNVPPPHAQASSQTDAQGRFTLRFHVGEPFSLEAEQFKPQNKAILTGLAGAAARQPVTLQLAPTSTIAGRVTASGAPILGGTAVYLEGTGYWTMTELDGSFSLLNVAAGHYRLKANRVGLGQGERAAMPESGRPLDAGAVDVRMQTPEVRRLLTTHAGPGTTIQLQGNHFTPRYDEQVQVRFRDIPATDVKVVHNRLLDVKVPPGACTGPVTVVVGGRASDASGAPGLFVVNRIKLEPPVDLYPGGEFEVPTHLVDTEGATVGDPHARNVSWRIEGDAVILREGEPKFLAVKPGKARLIAKSGTVEASVQVTVPTSPE